jgi:hypothetical protein
MAELTNDKQFRFQPQIQEVVNDLLPMLSKKEREFFLAEIEPLLTNRDWQVEDAISRALQCCGTSSAPVAGTVLTSDAFTRTGAVLGVSDAALGGSPKPWAAYAVGWQTASGKAQKTSGSTTLFEPAAVDTAVANVTVDAVVLATGSTSVVAGVTARGVDGQNYYTFYLYRNGSGQFQLYLSKIVANFETVLAGPTNVTIIPGATVGIHLTCTGSAISGTDGTNTLSVTDTTFATGTQQGITSIKPNVTEWDSFKVTAT